ncbi:MAG: hypothetical protein ACYDBJ_28025 [Aggregatilineales bacterium]
MQTNSKSTRRFRRWLPIAAALILVLLIGGLAFDLRAHGLVWRYLYSVTGEESALKQIAGFVGYLGNFTRPQPNTTVTTAIPYTGANLNPLGVNTFLENEVEPAKRERQMQMIHDAGFGWIRQQFNWDDIEISGRGDFIDRRNGAPISAWDKYDNIVDLANKYNVQIIARLNSTPAWSQAPDNQYPGHAPPADFNDFVNYAAAVAMRYKGRIHFYQVWNEPNIYPEWGNASINPEAYTDMLCQTYMALKAIDPTIVIISGALAPTDELNTRNLNEFIFLQRMYDAGAAKCFDILGAQGYGLRTGPADHRLRSTDTNFGRNLWLRDLMLANKDGNKPIWIGEMGWNPVPNDPSIADRLYYGQVTDEQAARYAVEAYQRARAEWPWVGVVSYWFFKRASDSDKDQSPYYFRLVDPDFTPRPAYNAIKQYAQSIGVAPGN